MNMDNRHVRQVAQDVHAKFGRLWSFVSDDVREACVDNEIMCAIRLADAVENQKPFTPAEVVAFRDEVLALLVGRPYLMGMDADREERRLEIAVEAARASAEAGA